MDKMGIEELREAIKKRDEKMKRQKIPSIEGELIKQGPKIAVKNGITSVDELFNQEIIGEFLKGSGQYVILPKGTKILDSICQLLDIYITKPVGFEKVFIPKMAPVDTFRKAGILGKWDDYLISAKPFSKTKGVKEEYLLDPLQCTTFYQFHEGKTIDISSGPIKWYDKSGPTYRNEDMDRIEPCVKQREFHRAEFIYLGSREQVQKTREKCLEKLEQMCVDLRLGYRIVVGGGCYQLNDGEIKNPETIEEIHIKDLEIYIPHENRWLEVSGSSSLGNTQTTRFNIKCKTGEELWSGCTGIGLERMIYSIVSNHGTDFKYLPKILDL